MFQANIVVDGSKLVVWYPCPETGPTKSLKSLSRLQLRSLHVAGSSDGWTNRSLPCRMPPRMNAMPPRTKAMPRRRVVGWVVWGRGEVDVGVVEQVRGMMAMATSAGIALSPTSFQVEAARDVWMRRSGSRRGHGHWWHEAWRPGSAPILSHAQIRVRVRVEASRVPVRSHQYGEEKKKGVVITGGTKGLGFSLARELLAGDAKVVICGRNEEQLNAALDALQREFGGCAIQGVRCDVSDASDVAALASFAREALGTIHFWINNAGEVTSKKLLADVDAAEIVRVSGTNVVGSLLCCREAIRLMRQQEPSSQPIYHIFNMGFSRWGATFTKSACTHKATKVALTQLTRSLSEELQAAGLSSIGVHNLSPGMVLTDLLLKDSTPVARRFFNTLAEEPETVAKDLVPRILGTRGTGQSIECLSPASAFFKVAFGFPQIISGGRFFDKDGNRVKVSGSHYQENGVKSI